MSTIVHDPTYVLFIMLTFALKILIDLAS